MNKLYSLVTSLTLLGIALIISGYCFSNELLFLFGGLSLIAVSGIMLGDYKQK